MKKLVIIAAVVMTTVAANAASWKWSAANIYDPTDSTAKLTGGTATLYTYLENTDAASAVAIKTASVSSGSISSTFSDTTNTIGGNNYNFFFVLEANGYTFTSDTVLKAAQATDTTTIGFGNLKTATTTGGGWVSSAAVPEPTSGLLLLLGMAGLALKRKRA